MQNGCGLAGVGGVEDPVAEQMNVSVDAGEVARGSTVAPCRDHADEDVADDGRATHVAGSRVDRVRARAERARGQAGAALGSGHHWHVADFHEDSPHLAL